VPGFPGAHFLEIGTQFVERLALAVGAGKTWHPPHIQTGVRVSFDDGSEVFHDATSLPRTIPEPSPTLQRETPQKSSAGRPTPRYDDVRFWPLMTVNPDAAASVIASAQFLYVTKHRPPPQILSSVERLRLICGRT